MGVRKGFFAFLLLILVWAAGKYLLPLVFPFLLGLGLALASEPAVSLGTRRFSRGAAAGLGVTLTLLFLLGIVLFLGALAVRELGAFAAKIPQTVAESADVLEDYLASLSEKLPEPVGPVLTGAVHRTFQDSAALTDEAVRKVPGMLSGILGKVPGSAMGLGTGILSGYFISARLPKLKQWWQARIPQAWKDTVLPTWEHLKDSLGKWLMAQGRLMGITYLITALGLWLLGIPYSFAWALLVAAVDAVPLLGTGTVLLPWALTKLLQGSPLTAAGMVVLYLVAMITRTVLEPRFYGKHLGMDPLVMLIFLYFGYRFWGFFGVIVSPLLATGAKALYEEQYPAG